MMATETPDEVFAKISIPEEWREVIMNQIKKRMGAKELKLIAQFQLVCYSEDGIEGIKRILLNAREKINETFADQNLKVSIRLVSPPHYEITTQSTSKSAGAKILKECLNFIEETSKQNNQIVFKVTRELEILGDAGVEDIESIFTKNLNMEENNSDSQNEDNEEGMVIDDQQNDDD